jgi:hypothetical protein
VKASRKNTSITPSPSQGCSSTTTRRPSLENSVVASTKERKTEFPGTTVNQQEKKGNEAWYLCPAFTKRNPASHNGEQLYNCIVDFLNVTCKFIGVHIRSMGFTSGDVGDVFGFLGRWRYVLYADPGDTPPCTTRTKFIFATISRLHSDHSSL